MKNRKTIALQSISASAFAPFGTLILPVKGVAIADAGSAFVAHPEASLPAMEWVHLTEKISLPLDVTRLEQHPFSSQTFLPHSHTPFLVVVCPPLANGLPDSTAALAFQVSGMAGVTFHAGVWHRSLAPMAAPSAFVMAMMRTGRNDDTVFHDLASPFIVAA